MKNYNEKREEIRNEHISEQCYKESKKYCSCCGEKFDYDGYYYELQNSLFCLNCAKKEYKKHFFDWEDIEYLKQYYDWEENQEDVIEERIDDVLFDIRELAENLY